MMTEEDDVPRLESGDGMLARKRFKSLKMEANVYQQATNLEPPLDPPPPPPMPPLPQPSTRSGWAAGNRVQKACVQSPKRKRTPSTIALKDSEQKKEKKEKKRKKKKTRVRRTFCRKDLTGLNSEMKK